MFFTKKDKVAFISILVNLLLFTIKLIAGLLSGATTLIADAIHSLSDLAAAISVYAGIKIANKKNSKFPYGLYKVENLVAIISAFAIFLAGYEILRYTIFSHETKKITNLSMAITAIILSIIITFLFSGYERKKGKELNSPSLIADAEHIKTDTLSSIVVLFGIFANYFGFPFLEKLATLIIVLFIFHSGFEILSDSLKVLLDASIDNETLQKIKEIILSFPTVIKINSLKGRNSGSYIFIESEIAVDSDSLEKVHHIIDEIEEKIKDEVPFVEKVIIHPEPYESTKKVIAIPLDKENCISKKFCECNYIFIGKTDEKKNLVEEAKIYPNPVKYIKKSRGVELVEFLKSKKVSCIALLSPPTHKGVLYAMAENRIKVALIDKPYNPYRILELAIERKLRYENALNLLKNFEKGAESESK